MQNISIERYHTPLAGFAGTITPESRAWIVFVDATGEAHLYRRTSVVTAEGGTESTYVLAGASTSPGG